MLWIPTQQNRSRLLTHAIQCVKRNQTICYHLWNILEKMEVLRSWGGRRVTLQRDQREFEVIEMIFIWTVLVEVMWWGWGILRFINVPLPQELTICNLHPNKPEQRNQVVGRMALTSLLDWVAKEGVLEKATTAEKKPFDCPSLLLLRGEKEESFCFPFYAESMCFN